jgi:nucleoside-diphosphate-sugar epimerase
MVRRVVSEEMPELGEIAMDTTPSNDLRSYHVSSAKIQRELGWAPRRTVEDAIRDLCAAFKAGKLPNSLTDPSYFNVKTVQVSELV